MIELMFSFGTEYILVRVDGHDVRFGNTVYGATMATIDGLKLNKAGVIKEFPDLEGNENWRIQAIERFKAKLGILATEEEISKYILEDLRKFGYTPIFKQVAGHRRVKLI